MINKKLTTTRGIANTGFSGMQRFVARFNFRVLDRKSPVIPSSPCRQTLWSILNDRIFRDFFIITILVTFGLTGFSQNGNKLNLDSLSVEDEMITYIETPPEFPGGEDSLWCFIESTLDFQIINYKDYQGNVLAFFEIDTTGKVINVQINPYNTQRLDWSVNDNLIENEIERVIKLMPDWKPGLQRDKPIRIKYTILIKIPYMDYKCKLLNNPTAAFWKVDKTTHFRYKGKKETSESLEKFIGDNMNWPSQDDCQGKVYVRVIINEYGELSDHTILRGLDSCRGFNEEALRLIELMPNWEPAKINGKPVKSYTVIPIHFILR